MVKGGLLRGVVAMPTKQQKVLAIHDNSARWKVLIGSITLYNHDSAFWHAPCEVPVSVTTRSLPGK